MRCPALKALADLNALLPRTETMPVLFVGHGSPMNAIRDNRYSQNWRKIGGMLPKPPAILCISAHWVTDGTQLTAMPEPSTIYDFGGFPQALFDVKYKAPGAIEAAELTRSLFQQAQPSVDVPLMADRGLDHGTWSVLHSMFPAADIPSFQLSMDYKLPFKDHYHLAKKLSVLRSRGVLIIGSGNAVHNCRAQSANTRATRKRLAMGFEF